MDYTLISMLVFLLVFLVVCGLSALVYLRMTRDERHGVSRLRDLALKDKPPGEEQPRRELLVVTLTKISKLLLPGGKSESEKLKKQLIQAGYFSPAAPRVFMGCKLLLMVILPALLVLLPHGLGLFGGVNVLTAALATSCLGMAVPNLWLSRQARRRQRILRQALPDAMDMLVLCMEGGVSLVGACQRMTEELQAAHPVLGAEMNVVQREIQLGLSVGQGLKKFGERCGLDEVRELANVLLQSERFGASVVKALRTHAESWRTERQQRAEEMAQKAAVKILFPTLLCIFAAIFIVLLGPAAFQMAKLFSK